MRAHKAIRDSRGDRAAAQEFEGGIDRACGRIHLDKVGHEPEQGAQLLRECVRPARPEGNAGAMAPCSLPAPPDSSFHGIRLGKKAKSKKRDLCVNGNKYRISMLTRDDRPGRPDHTYFLTNTQARGGFGKFRCAVDGRCQSWAIKEFRTEKYHPPVGKRLPLKTDITPSTHVRDEIATMIDAGGAKAVREVIEVDGKVYVIMPLMDGDVHSRLSRIPRGARTGIGRSVVRQLAADLCALHRKGYVHRDIKLQNALWNAQGLVTLTDWGTAKQCPSGGNINGIVGTWGCMAPEILRKRPYDRKVDTWSLGIAFADIYSPGDSCPFNQRLPLALSTINNYDMWRRAKFHATGDFDSDLGKGPWSDYFRPIQMADPDMFRFLLRRVLVPEPSGRASMQEVYEFVAGLQPEDGDEEKQAKRLFAKLARTNAEKLDALQAAREVAQATFDLEDSRTIQPHTRAHAGGVPQPATAQANHDVRLQVLLDPDTNKRAVREVVPAVAPEGLDFMSRVDCASCVVQ